MCPRPLPRLVVYLFICGSSARIRGSECIMRSVLIGLSVVAIVGPFLYLQNTTVDTNTLDETPVFYEPLYYTPLENDTDPKDTYAVDQLGRTDPSVLINITDFGFTMRPSKERDCDRGQRPLILALVHSATQNYHKRESARKSWLLHRDHDFVGLFMFGEVTDPSVQQALQTENEVHGDMVQGHFVDSYRNMTYKHVMSLKYATYKCPGARYVLKIDDDVAVDVPYLRKILLGMSPFGVRDLLLCSQKSYTTVARSYRSKWRMSFREYPSFSYPPYCSGGAVVYSPDVVFRIYDKAQKLPYFWVDDVHLTGTARVALNINPMYFLPNMNPFTLLH